jgi:hypothetical protein
METAWVTKDKPLSFSEACWLSLGRHQQVFFPFKCQNVLAVAPLS